MSREEEILEAMIGRPAPDHLFMQLVDAGFNNGALKICKWDSHHNFDGATKYLTSTPLREAAPELLTALKVLLNATMYKDHPAESQMAIDAIFKAEPS